MAWLAKSATDRKMFSLVVVRSFRSHHINLSKKQSSGEIFNFLTGDRGVGEGSCFQIGDRLIRLCVFWPGWIKPDPSPGQQHWGGLELLRGFEIVHNELKNDFMGRLELDLDVLIVNLGGSARLLPLLLKNVTTF